MMRSDRGFTLLETLVGLVLIGLGALAIAPLFVAAQQGNDAGGDIGRASALAVERMEQLRELRFKDPRLAPGGSLTSNVADPDTGIAYHDATHPGFVVRWRIRPNATPPGTRTVTVRAIDLTAAHGPRRSATLHTLRGE